MKKKIKILLILIVLLLLIIIFFAEEKNQNELILNKTQYESKYDITTKNKTNIQNNSNKYKDSNMKIEGEIGDAIIHEKGWAKPIKLQFNDYGWEDSPYISRDGNNILFFYSPIPNLADPNIIDKITTKILENFSEAIKTGIDGKIYLSKKPFNTKTIHPISLNKTLPFAQACPYISEDGDLFYCSNKEAFLKLKSIPSGLYKNNMKLNIDTNLELSNPHYCKKRDELWFDCPADTKICFMENAQKSNFTNDFKEAPSPINYKDNSLFNKIIDFQPFLTDDCNTLYFSSTRGNKNIIAIYKTQRINNSNKWETPKLFISHPAGVAEISITKNNDELVFLQLFWRDDGSPGADIYYSYKIR